MLMADRAELVGTGNGSSKIRRYLRCQTDIVDKYDQFQTAKKTQSRGLSLGAYAFWPREALGPKTRLQVRLHPVLFDPISSSLCCLPPVSDQL